MPRSLDRREFLEVAGAAALSGAFLTERAAIRGPAPAGGLRVAVLAEAGFPAADVAPLDPAVLRAALDGCEVAFLGVQCGGREVGARPSREVSRAAREIVKEVRGAV